MGWWRGIMGRIVGKNGTWASSPVSSLNWKALFSWRNLSILFALYLVAEIFTPLPKFARQLVSDFFPEKGYTIAYAAHECAPMTRLGVGLYRFYGYYAGLPKDSEVIAFLEQNRTDLERVAELFYSGVSVNYSPERFSEAEASEYIGLLRKLCMRVSVIGADPKPIRRMPDRKYDAYGDVLGFRGNIFGIQERLGESMRMGTTLVYWPPGEFSRRYRSCSLAGLESFVPSRYEEETLGTDRCCNISGTWSMCVTTLFK